MPEEHHLYSALQAQTSPGIQTYRDAPLPVLFRHNLPQPTQAQLMRGEFPETLCIEQGVVLSCRFAESKVRWTSRVLWMAVVAVRLTLEGADKFFTPKAAHNTCHTY